MSPRREGVLSSSSNDPKPARVDGGALRSPIFLGGCRGGSVALPPRFGHLTAIIDPDNLRSALDASIAHRASLIDGDKDNVLPGIHVRLGSRHTIGQQFVLIETAAGRRIISGDCDYSRKQFAGHNNDGVYVPLNNAVGSEPFSVRRSSS